MQPDAARRRQASQSWCRSPGAATEGWRQHHGSPWAGSAVLLPSHPLLPLPLVPLLAFVGLTGGLGQKNGFRREVNSRATV